MSTLVPQLSIKNIWLSLQVKSFYWFLSNQYLWILMFCWASTRNIAKVLILFFSSYPVLKSTCLLDRQVTQMICWWLERLLGFQQKSAHHKDQGTEYFFFTSNLGKYNRIVLKLFMFGESAPFLSFYNNNKFCKYNFTALITLL